MNQQLQPRWATLKGAAKYSGLSERYLQDFIRDGLIQSSLVRRPNSKKGRRLIDLRSLDEWIEQGLNEVDPPCCRKKEARES
jgi:hypothetical protein